jgi:uncharacterized iron-regulated protein
MTTTAAGNAPVRAHASSGTEVTAGRKSTTRVAPTVRTALLLLAAALASGCATAARPAVATAPVPAAAHPTLPGSGYTPHRIYDVAADAFIDVETLAARAAAVDVVFFGEQHGHGPGHRLQHTLLEAVGRRTDATLSMEMFERDVAPWVAGYASGDVDHAIFLAHARPWPRYFPDYHPLVEEARNRAWPVIAANVPRALAQRVAQEGVGVIDALPAAERSHAAAEILCPADDYRTRFITEMTRHPSGHGETDPAAEAARLQRYYESQCVKDETMAESIVGALAHGAPRPVIHVTGAFHTDHGDGIPVRVRRRMPTLSMFSLTLVPVADLDAIDPEPHRARADYLIFTLR